MEYGKFQNVAIKLLSKFGTSKNIKLKKDTENPTVDAVTKRSVKVYETYTGYGVKLGYETEAIGSLDNIIKAGDVKIICVFDVEPAEQKDQIIFGNDTFNIINVKKVDPDATTVVLYSIQCRRA